MQRNIRKQTRTSYECKKNSPKRDKIVRNLTFPTFMLRNTRPQLKRLCLGN